ncbi:uncharacterized protein [Drosophila suzukii]|uniref:Peptidase A2 domain-containing protein n=1 Tax=Drosophila suzukii TaxID=28584 RepID=A0ABM4TYU3_DROSZ
MTPNESQRVYGPRRLPYLPVFGGQPGEWPIFNCAFVETNQAYNCTDLENKQRLLKALKDEACETVKSLLIHPGNVSAVMEQLRFRFGRPEQLIRSQLNSVREVPPISEQHLARIVPFATRVSNLTACLQSAKAEQHLRNPTLMEELVAKLPTSKRVDWARHAASIKPFGWLQEYANVGFGRRGKGAEASSSACKRRTKTDAINRMIGNCPICGGQHAATSCKEFIGASPPDPAMYMPSARSTDAADCITVCYMARTRSEDGRRSKVGSGATTEETSSLQFPDAARTGGLRHEVVTGTTRGARGVGCPQKQPGEKGPEASGGALTLYGAGRQVDTYAVLDEGSSVTMIDDELQRDLGVRGNHRQLNILWFGGTASREPSNVVRLEISGAGKPTRHALRNVYSVSSLSLPMQTLGRRDVQGVHKDARLQMKTYINVVPKLLIGLDHGHLGLPLRTRRFAREGPYAAATELGWVVFGPVSGQSTTPSPRSCLLAVSMDDTLKQMVEDYFEMESFGVKLAPQVAASDGARAQRILEDTTVKRWQRRSSPGCVRDERDDERYVKAVNALKFRGFGYEGSQGYYVDDYVDSVSTRVKEIHAEAGFELCQFSSSSPIVEAALGPPGQVMSVGWDEAE